MLEKQPTHWRYKSPPTKTFLFQIQNVRPAGQLDFKTDTKHKTSKTYTIPHRYIQDASCIPRVPVCLQQTPRNSTIICYYDTYTDSSEKKMHRRVTKIYFRIHPAVKKSNPNTDTTRQQHTVTHETNAKKTRSN